MQFENIDNLKKYLIQKNIYKTKNNKFVITLKGQNNKSFNLGTYNTKNEAEENLFKYKYLNIIKILKQQNLNINDGKILNKKYLVFPNGKIFNFFGKELKGMIDRCGYREVIIDGKLERAHRIIAIAFVNNINPEKYDCVNHKDGNKLNNSYENLEWCNHSYNTYHAYQTGLEQKVVGENHHNHKLTESDVQYIRKYLIKYDSQFGASAMAKKFNVDKSTIMDAYNKKTWKEVV